MSSRMSKEQMDSSLRVAKTATMLNRAILDAIQEMPRLTYEEILVVLAKSTSTIAQHLSQTQRTEPQQERAFSDV